MEFSNKNENIQICEKKMMTENLYVNMAISEEKGLEAYTVFTQQFNS